MKTTEEAKDYYLPENLQKTEEDELSPSEKYRLHIRIYSTSKGCWNYSRGTVYRVSDNKEICDIKRNYGKFDHSFVTKNGQEYLISGRSYMGQTIINLDTGEEFELPKDKRTDKGFEYASGGFCWISHHLSPDENTLVVQGCHWACPYEIKFFDFTDPSKGWPQLSTEQSINDDVKDPIFNEDGTITCYESREFYLPLNKFECDFTEEEEDGLSDEDYDIVENWTDVNEIRLTLKRDGDKMLIVDKWMSEREKSRILAVKEGLKKWNVWLDDFKSTDPLYLEYIVQLDGSGFNSANHEAHGVCYKGWCPDFYERETRWCRRIHEASRSEENKSIGHTIDLEWAVKTGPIKLSIFKDGNTSEDKFFEHSVEGMRQAFDYSEQLIKTD